MAGLEPVLIRPPAPAAKSVGQMFNRIAATYNTLNHILSFGQDFFWRRKLIDCLDKEHKLRVLDMATGTGDVLISLLRRNLNIVEVAGLDISENMLALCRRRIIKYNLADRSSLIHADASSCPFDDETFDVVTMSFGIRNTTDSLTMLREMHRLLKPGGTVLILEFSIPSNRVIRNCYLSYLRRFVPILGRIISGDNHAYKYLNTSIENFDNVENFLSFMLKTGFSNVHASPLTFGVAYLYQGHKPAY